MARKKKGQKPDPQAGGDGAADPPGPSGTSNPKDQPQQGPNSQQPPPQGPPKEAQPQQQGSGAWQKGGQQQGRGRGKQQQAATSSGPQSQEPRTSHAGQQPRQEQGQGRGKQQGPGAWQRGGQQQQTASSPGPHPQQGARQSGGQQQQPRSQPPGLHPQQQQGPGAWQIGGQQQQPRSQPPQQPMPILQQPQGPWQGGAPQQQGAQPQQVQSAWQKGGQPQQPMPQPQQQQGPGAWQIGGQQQQPRSQPPQQPMPIPQQPQGPWQGGAPQQQGAQPQQVQSAWQKGGQPQQPMPQPQQQQGPGAWQIGGQQQQPRSQPPGLHPQQQQGPGAWQIGGQQQQPRSQPPGLHPQQQQGPGAWQIGGQQQQPRSQPPGLHPQQQQGPGAWQIGGQQQQPRSQPPQQPMPIPQQPQGPWQGGAPQQQGAQPQQQQPQEPGQKGGRQPPRGQQQRQGAIPKSQSAQAQQRDPIPEMQTLSTFDARGGTKGRKILVETNYLAIDFGKLQKAYHYDVQITPDTPKRWLRDVFEQFRRKHFPRNHPGFDGKRNMYTPYEILKPNQVLTDKIELDIPNEDKKKTYEVSVQLAAEVDLTPLRNMRMTSAQQAMQCVEIVLRSAPSMRCIQVGRSFYTPPPRIIALGEGMEMYYGFYQTVVRGWKPFFNVDVAHKAFPISMNVIELIAELGSDFRTTLTPEDLKRNPIDRNLETTLLKFLRTLRVVYEIPGMKREYRVNGLDEPPRYKKFTVDNVTMTIEEYFLRKKRIKLNYPLMPSLWVGNAQRADRILLPAEFCKVVENQAVPRKMTENQTSKMIKYAATSTEVRKGKIMDSLRNTRHNDDPCIKEFGFRINNDFERIQARVLDPPALEYGNGAFAMPSRGVWRQDNNRFYVGGESSTWVVISVCGNMAKECANLANMISSQSARCGMNLAPRPGPYDCLQNRQPSSRDVMGILQKHSKSYNLIFVVIPDGGLAYSYVKKAAEISLNCLTQCIKRKTLMKLNPSTVGNILLKVNSKLSGTNHCLKNKPPVLLEPCMIMGADVTHPSPDSKNIPSVVAVTASHDPRAMYGYNMCCRLQLPTVEIIEDLEAITIEHLKYFYQKNRGQKPYRIFFFRDGVSEGQFDEVRRIELSAIRRACSKVQEGYEPKITFIVVQKRHHTRFFPTNSRDSEDRNLNVPAGTCVDTVITSPNQQDFYLVSHASIQGVAKPTKYSTLWDDNDMSYDDIEQLSYYLCHLFSRCNRSVSYPAPTYYAHLGAARAKVYIESEQINFSNLSNEQRKLKNDVIRKEKPMFFV